MIMGGGSESTIIIGPSKSVLVYALHRLEYVLGLARFRVFVPKLYYTKDRVYGDNSRSLNLLKANIPDAIVELLPEMCRTVIENHRKSFKTCNSCRGEHFNDILIMKKVF